MLAILGPSGAGKTSLLRALSLGITSGKVFGSIKLNGKSLTREQFKDQCFWVEQDDHHWPFLTCRETISFTAELVLGKGNHKRKVDKMIHKMGLKSCQDTKVGHVFMQGLSGGQKRRLSIAIALLKKPAVIMLDEPTSGLDAAAALAIVGQLRKLAQRENLIIITTIHQPSSKIYNSFDQVMLLSKGKQAFMGKAELAPEYFASIGYPNEENINTAEFLLDLVNADFNSDSYVENILREWKRFQNAEKIKQGKITVNSLNNSIHSSNQKSTSDIDQFSTLIRRHALLIRRDPYLYVGRAIASFISCNVIALVYWNTRKRTQDQVLNFSSANNFLVTICTLFAVIAVYELNREFKSINREIKNGLINPAAYIAAKALLVLPIMFIFSVLSISTSAYLILNVQSGYLMYCILYAVMAFHFECIAEMFSVIKENPLSGMLMTLGIWFGSFLFAGLFLPKRDIPIVIRWLYYIFPFARSYSALGYHVIIDEDWATCDPRAALSAVCVDFSQYPLQKPGVLVLNATSLVYPSVNAEDNRWESTIVLFCMALLYKSIYIGFVFYKSSRATTLFSPS